MFIPTSKNTKTITDMRENALDVVKSAKKNGFVYVFYKSKPKAVLVDIDEFVNMNDLLEDYFDKKEAIKLSKEKRGDGITLDEIKKKYG